MPAINESNLNVIEIEETKEVAIKTSRIKEAARKRDEDNQVAAIEIARAKRVV